VVAGKFSSEGQLATGGQPGQSCAGWLAGNVVVVDGSSAKGGGTVAGQLTVLAMGCGSDAP
jgi:hypothetical protein